MFRQEGTRNDFFVLIMVTSLVLAAGCASQGNVSYAPPAMHVLAVPQEEPTGEDPGEAERTEESTAQKESEGFFAIHESDAWTFSVAPYAFMLNIDGDARVADARVDIDLDLGDILDYLDFGGMLALGAQKQKWGIFIDGLFMKLEDDAKVTVGPFTARPSVEFSEGLVDLAASYRFAEFKLGEGEEDSNLLTLSGYGGMRYQYLKVDLDVNFSRVPNRNYSRRYDWVEPLVGGQVQWYFTDTLRWGFRGDLSGFGIGSASELTWQMMSTVGWMPWKKVELAFGYRYLDLDYSRGSGLDTFDVDTSYFGPVAGAVIHF